MRVVNFMVRCPFSMVLFVFMVLDIRMHMLFGSLKGVRYEKNTNSTRFF